MGISRAGIQSSVTGTCQVEVTIVVHVGGLDGQGAARPRRVNNAGKDLIGREHQVRQQLQAQSSLS